MKIGIKEKGKDKLLKINVDTAEDFKFFKINGKILAWMEYNEKEGAMIFKEVSEKEVTGLYTTITNRITKAVLKQMEPEEFVKKAIRESLKCYDLSELQEMADRTKKNFSVKEEDGCFALGLGGKQGPRFELSISGDSNNIFKG